MSNKSNVGLRYLILLLGLLLLSACGEVQEQAEPARTRLLFSEANQTKAVALDDSTVSGTITIRLENESGIGKASFFLDSPEDGKDPVLADASAPFIYELDTTGISNGPHTLTVVATVDDHLHMVADSEFKVANAATPAPEPTPPPSTHWQPRPGLTWFWQLSGDIDMNQDVDVYDIDYQTTSAQVVETLHKQGKKVIAYVPVGDWEPYRPDSGDFPEAALCGKIDGWDERYIDIRHPKAVELIKARIALAASKGFDGIEGDVVDLHLTDTGCSPRITEAEMTAYLKELTAYAHSLGLAYFAKNVVENAADWSQFTDGAVVEEAYQYNEAAGYMPYINANKPVFAAEYGSNHPTAAECADANSRNYALYGTNLNLTGEVYKTCW